MAETKRYCEDCRFVLVPASGIEYARCTKTYSTRSGDAFVARALDSGEFGYASSARYDLGKCAPEANWFEPKAAAMPEAAE